MKVDPEIILISTICDHISEELLDGKLEQYLIQLHQFYRKKAPLTKITNTNMNR